MALLHRISDEDAERLLVGNVPVGEKAHGLEPVAAFVAALRTEVPASPPPGAEASLIARLSAIAGESGHRIATAPTQPLAAAPAARRRAWRPRVALAAKVAVAVALLPAAMAGLAFAGVTLPEPAREALERVGVELPNQSAVDEDSTEAGDSGSPKDEAGKRSGSNAGSSASGRGESGGSGKPSSGGQGRSGDRRENPNVDGQPGRDSSGQGTPQLGAPAPITPPGQGGTPPGQGGPSPSQGSPQSTQPQRTGPPDGTPPGQAKKD